MPKKTLRELSTRAIAAGLDPATPAVAVANATRPDETIVAGTIADIADRIEADAPGGPVLVMIGKVLAEVARRGDASEAEAYSAGFVKDDGLRLRTDPPCRISSAREYRRERENKPRRIERDVALAHDAGCYRIAGPRARDE